MLAPGLNAEQATTLAERIRLTVCETQVEVASGSAYTLTVSIGIAGVTPAREEPDVKTLAESLLAEAALDPAVREPVLDILSSQAPPARTAIVGRLLEEGNVRGAVEKVTPSEMFLLAKEMVARQKDGSGTFAAEIRRLAAEAPNEVNYKAISRAFGTPKPTLANSYQPELLSLRTFPTLMGYSSRIMAESWESNTLYWAVLADEVHLPPSQLNVLIPEWTQRVVERIFASHLEDWPALLKSLRIVGAEVRAKTRTQLAAENKAE